MRPLRPTSVVSVRAQRLAPQSLSAEQTLSTKASRNQRVRDTGESLQRGGARRERECNAGLQHFNPQHFIPTCSDRETEPSNALGTACVHVAAAVINALSRVATNHTRTSPTPHGAVSTPPCTGGMCTTTQNPDRTAVSKRKTKTMRHEERFLSV
jgi:hypothetical protein